MAEKRLKLGLRWHRRHAYSALRSDLLTDKPTPRRARRREEASSKSQALRGSQLICHRGQIDNAIAELCVRTQVQPNDFFSHYALAEAHWLKGMWPDFAQQILKRNCSDRKSGKDS
jgi:hypothetical protein